METTTKIELIDVQEDSDLLLQMLMEARGLLSKIETYRNWLFWTVIISFVVQIFGSFLTYILQINSWYWAILFGIPMIFIMYIDYSMNKLVIKITNMYQRCTSITSKIAQNIEKNYIVPKSVFQAIDLHQNDEHKKYFILSSLRETYFIPSAILTVFIVTNFFYGLLLSHQENQNKQLKTQIDSLNRVNQELIKKELKNK